MKQTRPRGRPRSFDREAAVEAAMLLFWERGYEATSLVDLTRALGIAPASLYAAFGSKDGLFYAAIERYGEKFGGFAPAMVAAAPSARALIAAMLEGAARAFTARGLPRGCMVISSALNCGVESADVERALRDRRRANEADLAARLRRARRDGELVSSADPDALAKYVATLIQGMSVQARDGADREALLAVARAAIAALDASFRRAPSSRRGARR
jgi:AcrR family transcriptional regulator